MAYITVTTPQRDTTHINTDTLISFKQRRDMTVLMLYNDNHYEVMEDVETIIKKLKAVGETFE